MANTKDPRRLESVTRLRTTKAFDEKARLIELRNGLRSAVAAAHVLVMDWEEQGRRPLARERIREELPLLDALARELCEVTDLALGMAKKPRARPTLTAVPRGGS